MGAPNPREPDPGLASVFGVPERYIDSIWALADELIIIVGIKIHRNSELNHILQYSAVLYDIL